MPQPSQDAHLTQHSLGLVGAAEHVRDALQGNLQAILDQVNVCLVKDLTR